MTMRQGLWIAGALVAIMSGTVNAAAPAVTPGYDWAVRINEDRVSDAILAYEVDGTDDQPLNFTCEEGGDRVFAGISGGAADLDAIELEAGDQRVRLTGKTDADELPTFTAQEMPATSPLFKAFTANGWLRMTAGGEVTDMVATPAGKKAIARFAEFCAG
ncbi:MAG: hypothetical protein JHC57_10695 [Sphingopyxis sp.]|uniref:hypothetical protein n=1 Tax=Sphingopyxis sp. TaxID=1908224 RepID=UPI001A1FC866|nr:hypothetical protein [Sphingopyxis sp.]MBJ7500206.1 hypothetical protein [Sphingopyxis sp.]